MNISNLEQLVRNEITQRWEEGYETNDVENKLTTILNGGVLNEQKLASFWNEFDVLPRRSDFPYEEPSTLEKILEARPKGPRSLDLQISLDEYYDKVYGAWMGRCVGCLLGKPVEGWTKEKIESYLKLAQSYPLDDYFPVIEPHPEGYSLHPSYKEAVRGRIDGMPRDDDIDYTILGLHILEEHGFSFTTEDLASEWLSHLPYYLVYTAERVAYRNLVNGLSPPKTATYMNPYREWIGAQIRGDIWGYVAPGKPETAAKLAFKDASLSHVKNGIYGELFVAAMISASFAYEDVMEIIEVGLSEIPRWSRLAETARNVIRWSKMNDDWQSTWERIMWAHGQYNWVHTINNAAFVLLGLLYGEGDLGKSVSISVMAGHDTDCNGATTGSIIGAILGAKKLPAKWVAPLNNRVRCILAGFQESQISILANRTSKLGEPTLTQSQ
jgi:ADP-ribosylglycohydrolase